MIKVWKRPFHLILQRLVSATWVYRITMNKWIDHQFKCGRMALRASEMIKVVAEDEALSAEEGLMTPQSSDVLRENINQLLAVHHRYGAT